MVHTENRTVRAALLDSDFRPHHYEPLKSIPGLILQPTSSHTDPRHIDCDIGLLGDEFNPMLVPTLHELNRRGTPTLHMVDGIIEWRNVWTNPRSNTPQGRPLFQPVSSSRIACLGLWQALLLESLGNHPLRCEITGSPRLDYLDSIQRRPDQTVLIASANTPGFTPAETEKAADGMRALHARICKYTHLKPHWRLAPTLWAHLDFTPKTNEPASVSLASLLGQASAVITTPSTLALEAMRVGIPTLIIDFTNSPAYLMSAWRATCPDTLSVELESLLEPRCVEHARRRSYQTLLSRLQMEPGSATERVGSLINLMVQHPEANRSPSRTLLPRRSAYPEGFDAYQMGPLYPMIPAASATSLAELQSRLITLDYCLRELAGYRRRRLVRFSDWIREHLPLLKQILFRPHRG